MQTRQEHNEYNRLWAKKHRTKYAKYLKDWRIKRMIWFQSLKQGKSCQDCGENDIICLDYHHLDPKTKEGLPQSIAKSTVDNEKVLAEIAKCDLICSNCHRKRHFYGKTI